MTLLRAFQISALFISAPVFLIASSAAQTASFAAAVAGAKTAAENTAGMPIPMNTSLVAPLVIDSADWTSVLTLVNESKTPAHARISLQAAGENMMSVPITQTVELLGHSSTRLSIQTLLAGHGTDFFGSLTVQVQEPTIAKNMAVAAQLTLIGRGNLTGESADEELIMPMMGGSLKAVAQSRKPLIAIQNSGMRLADVTISCLEHGTIHQSALAIPAGEMQFLQGGESFTEDFSLALPDLSSVAATQQNGAEPGEREWPRGLAYEVSSASSELAAFGLSVSLDQQRSHAAPVIFTHQSEFTSRSTVFAGIPVGSFELLPGVALAPELALANFTDARRRVTVSGVLSGNPAPPEALTSVSLEPLEVKRIQVPLKVSNTAGIASLLVEQDGAPGAVISSLIDRDLSGETSLVPLPKFLHHANNGGGHPWSLESGTSSSLLLFNASSKPEIVNLNFGTNGIVWHDTITMTPYENRTMNLSDLIISANESNAEKKHPDPAITAKHGEISWFTASQADVFGRVLIARQQNGGRALESYSCGYNIVMCGSYLDVATATFPVGGTGTLGAINAQTCTSYDANACSGQSYQTGGSGYSYTWSSNNTNIATISGSSTNATGTFLGISGGTAIGQGVISNGKGCAFVADGTNNVQVPTASRITQTINDQPSAGTPYCKAAGFGGWLRIVQKIVTDQNGADMVVYGQTLTEKLTFPVPNAFGITQAQIGRAITDAQGHFTDTFFVCTNVCPGSTASLTVTQSSSDSLNGNNYTLANNSLVYRCSSIKVNGQ